METMTRVFVLQHVHEYELDEDHWAEGFVSADGAMADFIRPAP